MLKKIAAEQLTIGMYVGDFNTTWINHPFIKNKLKISSAEQIDRIHSLGISHVYIDPEKGLDIAPPSKAEFVKKINHEMEDITEEVNKSTSSNVAEELDRARSVINKTYITVEKLMDDVRKGRKIELGPLEQSGEYMVNSILRNHNAVISLLRIKSKDVYTFQHSLSVSALMIAFANAMNFNSEEIQEAAVGGFVHDIGKMRVPDNILNKPGKHNDEEFKIMRQHVVFSRQILEDTPGISQNALDISSLHHERVDGTGYPDGLVGDEISLIGKMSTIVDVYDALTSVRIYKNAWEPTMALRKLLEWSDSHFDRKLVEVFIKMLGVYPVGTLVELDSGRLGIIIEANDDNPLNPTVRIIYNSIKNCYIAITEIDLATSSDCIKDVCMPSKYNIDLNNFY